MNLSLLYVSVWYILRALATLSRKKKKMNRGRLGVEMPLLETCSTVTPKREGVLFHVLCLDMGTVGGYHGVVVVVKGHKKETFPLERENT